MDFRLFFTEFILASKSSIPSLMRKVFHCIAALNVNIVNCLAELTLMYVPLNRVALLLDIDTLNDEYSEYGSLNLRILNISMKDL